MDDKYVENETDGIDHNLNRNDPGQVDMLMLEPIYNYLRTDLLNI